MASTQSMPFDDAAGGASQLMGQVQVDGGPGSPLGVTAGAPPRARSKALPITLGVATPPLAVVVFFAGLIIHAAAWGATPAHTVELEADPDDARSYTGTVDTTVWAPYSVQVSTEHGLYAWIRETGDGGFEFVVYDLIEVVAAGDGGRTDFVHDVDAVDLRPRSVSIRTWTPFESQPGGEARGEPFGFDGGPQLRLGDDGDGNFQPDHGVSGTIDYATGVVNVTFDTAPANGSYVLVGYASEAWPPEGLVIGTMSSDGQVSIELPREPPNGTSVNLWYNEEEAATGTILLYVANPLSLVIYAGIGGALMRSKLYLMSMAASGVFVAVLVGGCFFLVALTLSG